MMYPVEGVKTHAYIVSPSEEDRGILLLDSEQTGVGRTARIPVEDVGWIDTRGFEATLDPCKPLGRAVSQVDHLLATQQAVNVAIIDSHRQQHLAQCSCLCDLREAPTGV